MTCLHLVVAFSGGYGKFRPTMKIHEYQAKELLKKYGVAVPEGSVATSTDEAVDVAKKLGGRVVVKAQIHAGGRGKGGGIKLAKDHQEAKEHAEQILGMNLVTPQTGPEGRLVKKVLVEAASDIDQELYLGLVLDRSTACVTLMGSAEGGMEIEKVAAKNPESIFRIAIDSDKGLSVKEAVGLGKKLGLDDTVVKRFGDFATALYDAYIGCDAILAEINPLVITKGGEVLALDTKINLDDNSLFRHKEFSKLIDPDEEDPAELEAKNHGLSYINLDGDIGCMVNGAGLAMATMDIIKFCGGEPANFLDVGGNATKENVTEAFKIILHDPKLNAILINIFGGIVKCDLVAGGIAEAARDLEVRIPLVVRLQGTNLDEGREILQKSGLNVTLAETLDEAARMAVEASGR